MLERKRLSRTKEPRKQELELRPHVLELSPNGYGTFFRALFRKRGPQLRKPEVDTDMWKELVNVVADPSV